jgi:hypothetical protein
MIPSVLWKSALAIDGGIAAAMAIVTSAFNSDHPNYGCRFLVPKFSIPKFRNNVKFHPKKWHSTFPNLHLRVFFFFQFLNIKYFAIYLIIRKIIRNSTGKKNQIFWPKKDKFYKQKRRKEHSISFHQVKA